jgi:hypothetical protein
MTRTTNTIMAMTNRMWMSPPIVYEVTNPSSQRTSRITIIDSSISYSLVNVFQNRSDISQIHRGCSIYEHQYHATATRVMSDVNVNAKQRIDYCRAYSRRMSYLTPTISNARRYEPTPNQWRSHYN